jgi:hypothetical protein
MELFCAWAIRDNLTLNVMGFVAPTKTVNDWQAGSVPKVP